MKTNTTKFLAVLAVFAMAFALFAVNAETNDAADSRTIDLDFNSDVDFSNWSGATAATKTVSNKSIGNMIEVDVDTSDEECTVYTITGYFAYQAKSGDIFADLGMTANNLVVFNVAVPKGFVSLMYSADGESSWASETVLGKSGASVEPDCYNAISTRVIYIGYCTEENATAPVAKAKIVFGTEGTNAAYNDNSTYQVLNADMTTTFDASAAKVVVTKDVKISVTAADADIIGMILDVTSQKLFIAPGVTLTVNISGTIATGHYAYGIQTTTATDFIGLGSGSKIVVNDTTTAATGWTASTLWYHSMAIGKNDGPALTFKGINLDINQTTASCGFGIYAEGLITFSDSTATIDSSNRAIQAELGLTIEDNSNISANGGEKGVIVTGGALTVGTAGVSNGTDKSVLSVKVLNTVGYNAGVNDRWGLRVTSQKATINSGATLNADAVLMRAGDIEVEGTLNIEGSDIAGYYNSNTNPTITYIPAGLIVSDNAKTEAITLGTKAVKIFDGGIVNLSMGAAVAGLVTDGTDANKVKFGIEHAATGTASETNPNTVSAIFASANSTLSHGSVVITGDFITDVDGNITVTGQAKISGELDVALTINSGATLTVEANKTFTVGSNGNVTVDASAQNPGELIVSKGGVLGIAGKVTGLITNNGEVDLLTGGDITGTTFTGSGKFVDKTDDEDMKDLVIGGDSEGKDTKYSSKQKVIVSSELGYWNLNNGSEIIIEGVLVIPEGTKLVVQAGAELVIRNDAKVYVYGELIIEEGVKGTPSIKDGKFTLVSGIVSIEGTVDMNGDFVMEDTKTAIAVVVVEDGGNFVINENGVVTTPANAVFGVDVGGDLTVYGTMGATIYNRGSITINSDVAVSTATTIKMMSEGATVSVVNYTVLATEAGKAKLTITDSDLVFTTYKDSKTKEDVDVILKDKADIVVISMTMTDEVKTDYSMTFSGIQIVAGVSVKSTDLGDNKDAGRYNGKQYSKSLDVSGAFVVDYTYIGSETGADKTVTAKVETTGADSSFCSITVKDAITLFDNVTLKHVTGALNVTGSIASQTDKANVENAGTITVSGEGSIIVLKAISSETNMNAAKFITTAQDTTGKTYKIYNYYSIDGALAVVTLLPATNEIDVLGKQTMTASASLPASITLVLMNSSELTINSDVTFNVNNGATVKGEGTIYVNGTMYAEEKTNVKSVTIVSDVKTEQLDEKDRPAKTGWAMWTNLTAALEAAETGSIVTITKTTGYVTISKNMTVPYGITLAIPEGTVGILLKNGVTLTIDGIVVVESNIYAQQAFGLDAQSIKLSETDKSRQSSAIVVNGALISKSEIKYGNGYAAMNTQTSKDYYVKLIGGTYVDNQKYTTDGTSTVTASSLAVVAPIAGAYYQIKDGNDTYYAISSIEMAAEFNEELFTDITIHGDVGGLSNTFVATDYFDAITIPADANITAPTRANKIVTELTMVTLGLDGVSLVATDGYFSGIVGNGTAAMTFLDTKGMTVLDKNDKLYVYGAMTATTEDAGAAISLGTVYLGYNTEKFGYTGKVADDNYNYLVIGEDAIAIIENGGTIDLMMVEGTFQVPANKSVTVNKELIDLGVIEVAAVTETSAKGDLQLAGKIYIGCDGKPAAKETSFEIASISGPVTFNAGAVAYVMPDAIIDLDTAVYFALLKHTTYFIEDEEFFTMFAESADTDLDKDTPKILDAVISKWVDENGDSVDGKKVGAVDEVYADINYNIYSVYIVTDAGVKSVAINGIELVNQGGNVFTLGFNEKEYKDFLKPLIAGTYKVTFTLKSGYQEDKNGVTLYTEDGTVLKDRSFVASGAYEPETIKLQLNGTEIIPEPEPVVPEKESEWTITTILLVVLVILIAIMAVIVALRLNRN